MFNSWINKWSSILESEVLKLTLQIYVIGGVSSERTS